MPNKREKSKLTVVISTEIRGMARQENEYKFQFFS